MAGKSDTRTGTNRRTLLRSATALGLAQTVAKNARILVAYFSRTGNTREVAEQIHRHVGGDLFEVRAVKPYPAAYRATTDQSRHEQETNARPELTARVDDMAGYDIVFVGYPNWWGTMPMALFTFLESYDFSGKTIVPFCTHEGSSLGRSESDIRRLCPDATLLEGIACHGASNGTVVTASDEPDVVKWLGRIGFSVR